jgi:hypothetical protein
MRRLGTVYILAVMVASALLVTIAGCDFQTSEQRKPRTTLFVGVDASGSFKNSGVYDNALTFLAYYIYGHLNELGGLDKPQALFVGSVGGKSRGEPKTFHPIHDFEGKSIEQIEADLRTWFAPNDVFTDFNPFFQEVARITKERNLVLAPITVMVVTDGLPDVPDLKAGSQAVFQKIDFNSLEYLSRNITVRLVYVNPKIAQQWRTQIPRQRVRLWTVDAEVMKGWTHQLQPGVDTARQDRFWKWVLDNVDFRVRSVKL